MNADIDSLLSPENGVPAHAVFLNRKVGELKLNLFVLNLQKQQLEQLEEQTDEVETTEDMVTSETTDDVITSEETSQPISEEEVVKMSRFRESERIGDL